MIPVGVLTRYTVPDEGGVWTRKIARLATAAMACRPDEKSMSGVICGLASVDTVSTTHCRSTRDYTLSSNYTLQASFGNLVTDS